MKVKIVSFSAPLAYVNHVLQIPNNGAQHMKKLPDGGYVSFGFLAEHYDVATNTIHRWVRDGYIPRPLFLSDGTSRFDVAEIREWEQKQKEKQAQFRKRREVRNKLMVEARKRKAQEKTQAA